MSTELTDRLQKIGIDVSVCTEVIATTNMEECRQLLEIAETNWNHFQKQVQNLCFEKVEEEIFFYKEIKPSFHYPFVFYSYLKHFLGRYQILNPKGQQGWVRKCLRTIDAFYRENQGFLAYLAMHEKHMDHVYFSFREEPKIMLDADQIILPFDFGFQNRYDLQLTYYLTFRKAEKFLKELKNEKQPKENGFQSELKWTGSKSAFNELIYALHESKAISKGEMSINQLIPAISSFFNLDPGDYYKSINEIKNRKKERTKFLNQLVATLEEKFESDDRF